MGRGIQEAPHVNEIKLGNTEKAYHFNEIDENEHTQLFLLWLLEVRCNAMKADSITLTSKVDCLLQLVCSEAKSKVARSFKSSDVWTLLTAPEQTPASVCNCFTNITI